LPRILKSSSGLTRREREREKGEKRGRSEPFHRRRLKKVSAERKRGESTASGYASRQERRGEEEREGRKGGRTFPLALPFLFAARWTFGEGGEKGRIADDLLATVYYFCIGAIGREEEEGSKKEMFGLFFSKLS